MNKIDKLFKLANELAIKTDGFFDIKGPGKGNLATNSYIKRLGELALDNFGINYSEKKICGPNSLAVDFYFPDEATIVEIALGVKKPNSEFEKDILKALMAKAEGNPVNRLVYIAKPGGVKKCNQPGRKAFRSWVLEHHKIKIEVFDLDTTTIK